MRRHEHAACRMLLPRAVIALDHAAALLLGDRGVGHPPPVRIYRRRIPLMQ